MTDDERTELLFKFTRFKSLLEILFFKGQENYNKVIESVDKDLVNPNPSDFKFPTVDISGVTPTYVFNGISADDAERIIKEITSNNNGGNIKINFADKK